MAAPVLVKVPIQGKADSCLLVHVTSESASQPLDLTLRATDGVERTLERRLDEFAILASKDERFRGSESDEDLKAIFSYIFLKTPVENAKLVENLDVAAAADGDAAFKLRIRRNFGKVKQPILSIPIADKEEIELDVFTWAREACEELDAMRSKLSKHASEMREKDDIIRDLTSKIETLTALKKEHEDLLLVKFKELLNTKKAKIRELGRQLEQANERKAPEAQALPEPTPEPEPAPPKGRRKATAKPAPAPARPVRKRKPVRPPSDSEDSDFGPSKKMEIDEPPKRATRAGSSKPPPKAPAPAAAADDDDDATASDSEDEAQVSEQRDTEDEDELPPIRKPIQWRNASAAVSNSPATLPAREEKAPTPAPTATYDAAADETDDDEL